MKHKVIWIVNEYNLPGVVRTRQTVLSQHLTTHGYDVYLICGSTVHKTGCNTFSKGEKIRETSFDNAKYFMVRTGKYHNGIKRIIVALQFQFNTWRFRNLLPKPDVIISDFAGLFGNYFFKWKKKYGTKLIFDILDLWPEGFVDMGYLKKNSIITKLLYAMEHRSYRDADGIVFSFQGGRDYIIDKGWSIETGGDVDTKDIGYLNNGVDLGAIDKQKEEFHFDDDDLNSSKFKVIYLGSISAFNGVDALVETARVLQERNADNVLILVYGFGNQEEKLKQMVLSYSLHNIKFKGPVDKKYAMDILSRGDLNAFTFKQTPLLKYGVSPNKLFMYFASGKPVLSMIKPAYDLVEGCKAGISVENDPVAVADAIMQFTKMQNDEYEEYCKNARLTAQEYDYGKLVNVLINKIEG